MKIVVRHGSPAHSNTPAAHYARTVRRTMGMYRGGRTNRSAGHRQAHPRHAHAVGANHRRANR